MNRALLYLWAALLRRKAQRLAGCWRRPLSLLGLLALLCFLGFLYHFRESKIMGELVRRENLVGGALVMLWGSVFKGLLQRGLACEPADIEFLFTSPFTQRQIVLYRLLPNYLFAVVQSLLFLLLFRSHFVHWFLTGLCLVLFQIACFHLATAAAIFAGGISEHAHYRLRWMMLALFTLLAAAYLRLEWDLRLVPSFCASPIFQLAFYPAVTLPDALASLQIHQWAARLWGHDNGPLRELWPGVVYVSGFAAAALASLGLLFQFKTNILEAACDSTSELADQRRRLREGLRAGTTLAARANSVALPGRAVFQGVGAVVWKNVLSARRSRREMLLASIFVLAYTGFFTALLWIYHDLGRKAGGVPLYEARAFTSGIALFLAVLGFFLQRMFPFDFRRDGSHLLMFRTLPVSSVALALAEIAVPSALCLAAQLCGVVPLVIFGKFDGPTMLLVALGYPAVCLALNSVWNLHYLLAATRRIQGRSESSSAVGMVLVVALSFLVFYPAGWTAINIAKHFPASQSLGFTLATAGGLAVQVLVNLLLILAMARCFQRFEASRQG